MTGSILSASRQGHNGGPADLSAGQRFLLEGIAVVTKYFNAKGGIVDSATIIGVRVENPKGEHLGRIESLMLDLDEARILYVVLSFGGFLGVGDKLFPVPIEALMFGTNRDGFLEKCILDIDKEKLKNAPGFDRNSLPTVRDRTFAAGVYIHYGYSPYWDE
jgi:sporulation protein YlmC with PRC-barrel domain